MRKLIFLFMCLAPTFLGAQSKIDSLINVLNTKTLTTDAQLNLYKDICQYYFASYDSGKTMEYAKKGLALSEKAKNDLKSALFNEYIGYAYKDEMNHDTAYIYFERGLGLAIKAGDIGQQVSAYLDIGAYYGDKEMWDLACEQFLKALPLSERLDDKAKYTSILGNIGSVHRALDNPDKAILYFEQMKEMAEKENNLLHQRKAYYELGVLYKDKMEYDKSLEYLQIALDISRNTESKIYEAICLQTLALFYSKDEIKDYSKAIQYAKESLVVAEDIVNPLFSSVSWTTLSSVYYRQEKYKESINAAYQAIESDSTNMSNMLTLYNYLTDSYLKTGNNDSATVYFHKYRDLKDRLITKDLQESIAKMETQYETEKKEFRIAVLEEERKLYIVLSTAIVVVLLLGVGLLFYRHRSAIQKRKMAEQQIKQLEQEQELIATRAALDAEKAEREVIARDLHDGVGAMLSVVKNNMDIMKSYSVIENREAEYFSRALEGLDKSITELRRVAHHIMPAILVEKGLFVALDDFCRSISEVEFHFTESGRRFDREKELILYRCAYELVNNSLRHSGAFHIDVHLSMDEKTVYLSVVDNGCGFDPQATSMGMGINNMRTRLSAFNGRIDFYSEQQKGTEVNVELDL